MKKYNARLNHPHCPWLAKGTQSVTLLAGACLLLLGVVVAQAQPTENAPTPTAPPESVLSMFNSSGTYTDHAGIGWYAPWSVATQADYPIPGATP